MLDFMHLVSSALASYVALDLAIPWVGDVTGNLDVLETS